MVAAVLQHRIPYANTDPTVVRLDHPLLVGARAILTPKTRRNLVTGVVGSFSGNSNDTRGWVWVEPNSNFSVYETGFIGGAATVSTFVFFDPFEFAVDYTRQVFYCGVESVGKTMTIMAEDGTASVGFYGHRIIAPKNEFSPRDLMAVCCTLPNGQTGSAKLYINGKNKPWTTEGGSPQTQNFDYNWTIAFGAKVTSSSFRGRAFIGVVWDRLLSDAEAEALTADPWQLFAPRRTVFLLGAAGGYTANISASFPQITSAVSSVLGHNADISTSLPALQSTISASRVLKASVQAVLQALTASLTADVIAPGTKTADISARLPNLQAALAATRGLQADLSAVLPALRASASTTLEHIASVSASLANLQATLSAGKVQTADIATSLPSLVASLTASQAITARISAQLPRLQGSSSAELVITAFIAASLSALQASLGGSVTRVASAQTTLPSLSARIISGRLKRSFEVYRSVSQIKLAVRLESKLDQRSFRATSRLGVQSE